MASRLSDQQTRDRGLWFAIGRGDDATNIGKLLEGGANAKVTHRDGTNTLHHAAEHASAAVVGLLAEKGAEVDGRNAKNQTPLFFAAQRGTQMPGMKKEIEPSKIDEESKKAQEVVQALIDLKADPNATDTDRFVPMHYAATSIFSSVVKLLADAKADVGALNHQRVTPLHFAVTSEAVNTLVEKNANVNAPHIEGGTPLDLAIERGSIQAATALKALGAERKERGRDYCEHLRTLGSHHANLRESLSIERIFKA